jgi:hypothetical protein
VFFSSEKVQTRVANQFTKRINTTYATDISIGKVKINFQGDIDFREIVVLDHRLDTLLYVESIAMDLEELEAVLKGNYQLTTVEIDQPKLFVNTYAGDSRSNLDQFIEKFKQKNAEKKAVNARIEALSLNKGIVVLQNESRATNNYVDDIQLSATDLAFQNDSLQTNLVDFSLKQKEGPNLSTASGKLLFTPNQLRLEDFYAKSKDSFVDGDLTVITPDFSKASLQNSATITLNISESRWDSSLFSLPYWNSIAPQISLSGDINGRITALEVNLAVGLKHKSQLEVNASMQFDKDKKWKGQFKTLAATISKADLVAYLDDSIQPQIPLLQLNWDQLSVLGSAAFNQKQSALANLEIGINEGALDLDVKANKLDTGWEITQAVSFKDFGKGKLVDPNNEISINGEAQLTGTLAPKGLSIVASGKLTSLFWNNRTLKAIQWNGKITPEQRALQLEILDNRAPLSLSFKQDLIPEEAPFSFDGIIEGFDLSTLGISPPDDDVKLYTEIQLSGNKHLLSSVKLSEIKIDNRLAKHRFSNVDLRFKDQQGVKSVVQSEQGQHPFVFRGNFAYSTLGLLVENALREALLLPQLKPMEKEQNLIFDFTLDKDLVQALYPVVNSPESIRFKGKLSSKSGVSKATFDLPYLAYKGYRFDELSLKASLGDVDEITQFYAKNIEGDGFALSDVSLVTRNESELLQAKISGQLGKLSKRDFSADFSFQQFQKQSRFELNALSFKLGKNVWSLDSVKPTVLYDNKRQRVQVENFKLRSGEESLQLEGYYQSNKDYTFALETKSLDLAEALPKGDKFNFAGRLDALVELSENVNQQLRSANLQVDDLIINKKEMGDFIFSMGGSSQLKTYPIKLLLIGENTTPLKGTGALFTAGERPNLSLDLDFDRFDIAFLSALGKDKLTDIEGKLSGALNLWGEFDDLKLRGNALLDESELYIPSVNVRYGLEDSTVVQFRNRNVVFPSAVLHDKTDDTRGVLSGELRHLNFSGWELELNVLSERLLVYNRVEDPETLFYGQGYLNGLASFNGPTKLLTLEVTGSTAEGTTLVIPWQEDKGLSDTSFIDYLHKGEDKQELVTADISAVDEDFRGLEMIFNLDINRNATVEIVVDQSSGSTLSGRGAGNVLIETNIDGKFNIWGDFIAYDGIYNFKNLGVIDKRFAVQQGGTIVWEGDPLEAQLNIEATYQVPGGANPALLVDNPNFNRKIPTNVEIQLIGNLLKPDDPVFDITFPNATGIVVSEINYRLADQQRRQLQAISLLSQGIFISDVSVSFQGITNNLYEKASDVFSTLIGANDGKVNVGVNYLQGEENPNFDLRTEDRIGLTLSTQLSDRILINGKIGVPIDGVQETVIVGDVQIDFILNESGTLKAKVFNRENDFRYLGDEFGYTQGMGMSYQVDFNTFQELIQKIKTNALKSNDKNDLLLATEGIDFLQKQN